MKHLTFCNTKGKSLSHIYYLRSSANMTQQQYRSIFFIHCILLVTLSFAISKTWGHDQNIDLPVVKVYLWDRSTKEFIIINQVRSTDNSVKIGDTVLFACEASFPVQWVYNGYGAPILSTNTSILSIFTYSAMLQAIDLKEHSTGQYKCISSENPEIFSFFHLYVPGPSIFTLSKGKDILFSDNENQVKIPCAISQNTAIVQLKKYKNDILQDAIDSSIANYDPRHGFTLNLKSMKENPEGTYICTAANNNEFRAIEFSLTSKNDETMTFSAYASSKNENKTSVVPKEKNACRSFYCAAHEECKIYNGAPKCVCKPGRLGSDCTLGCFTDRDCLKHQRCETNSTGYSNTCVSRCEGHICASNGECYLSEVDGSAMCRCKNGYEGNPDISCNPVIIAPSSVDTGYCRQCGPYSKCQLKTGKNACVCQQGAVGTPPNCKLGCGNDQECPFDKKCSPLGECVNICDNIECGQQAVCRVLRRQPMCVCKIGFNGDPTIACYANAPKAKSSDFIHFPQSSMQ